LEVIIPGPTTAKKIKRVFQRDLKKFPLILYEFIV